MSLIKLSNARKTYIDGELKVDALRGVSLDISVENFAMIVGPSGCGKTTLLNILGCLDVLTAGQLTIDGQDVCEMKDRDLTAFRASKIGFIFQNFSLIPVLSAYENVEYGLAHTKMPRQQRRQLVEQALESVGLASRMLQRPNQLSGGQRQRVAIARALVKKPSLVLADEPTANLDSETGASIISLMRKMQSEYKTTFIFSTHDPALMSHADHTVRMQDGAVISDSLAGKGVH